MDKDKNERFRSMAIDYDKMAQLLIPKYDFLQDNILDYLKIEDYSEPVVIDLGAGSGIFLEKILKRNKDTKCYWIDFSEDFLKIAKQKLSKFKSNVEFILSSIEDTWETKVRDKPNFIFSMFTIHHLENDEKNTLYKRCFEILVDNGWFINIDEMKTLYHDAYLKSLYFWDDHVNKNKFDILKEDIGYYNRWLNHFKEWRIRNIDNIDKPKSKGDDLHELFTKQMEWLKEIGFKNVDLFIKYHLWCAIGGQKII